MHLTNDKHPMYLHWLPAWQDCRNAFDGQRAIKAAGVRYLPALSGQTNDEYLAYKNRALFFSITSKTVSALVGMALQRPPILTAPPEMNSYGIDRNGAQLTELTSSSLSEVLLTGRYGLMVDMPQGGGKPYLARYTAENIVDWVVDREGHPSKIVLQESVIEDYKTVLQYRCLYLEGGVYYVAIYNEKMEMIGTPVAPKIADQPMDFIPFVLMNPVGIDWDILKPPMLDIVDINLSHYRTSADLEHGRHFTGLPTPVVSGVDGSTVLKIGSQTAWVLPPSDAKAYYLEFTGTGLKSLEAALQEKQSQLASLSARLMDNSHKGSEAADAVRLRFMSETASLLMVVLSVEDGLSRAHQIIATVLGEDPKEVSVKVNREFLSSKLSAAEVVALTKVYLEGGMSVETYVYNLRRGDMLPHNMTDEDVLKQLPKRVDPTKPDPKSDPQPKRKE